MNTFYKMVLFTFLANVAFWSIIIGVIWHFVAKFW